MCRDSWGCKESDMTEQLNKKVSTVAGLLNIPTQAETQRGEVTYPEPHSGGG